MPWATHRLVDDQALGKWSIVVGAVGRDGEDLLSHTGQENSFPVSVPNQHLAIGQAFRGNTLGKIRSGQLGLLLAQTISPGEE